MRTSSLSSGSEAGAPGFERAFSEAGRRPRYFRSVQDAAWKLVYAEGHGKRAAAAGPARFELYDLARDPLETTNVATANAEQVRRLRRELFGWMKRGAPGEVDEGGDAETEKALRALGYTN